jgi:hypothetical protein
VRLRQRLRVHARAHTHTGECCACVHARRHAHSCATDARTHKRAHTRSDAQTHTHAHTCAGPQPRGGQGHVVVGAAAREAGPAGASARELGAVRGVGRQQRGERVELLRVAQRRLRVRGVRALEHLVCRRQRRGRRCDGVSAALAGGRDQPEPPVWGRDAAHSTGSVEAGCVSLSCTRGRAGATHTTCERTHALLPLPLLAHTPVGRHL